MRDDGPLIERLGGALPVPASTKSGDRWLATLAAAPGGAAFGKLVITQPLLVPLLSGIAEAAPYLRDLVDADPARFARLLASDPQISLQALLGETRSVAGAANTTEDVMRILRRMKCEAALLVALADIGNVWPVASVTRALTDVGETALGIAVDFLLADAAKRGRLAPAPPGDEARDSGYIVVAMGKMGGYELNFSSDIDLMVFYDPAAARLGAGVEPAQFYVGLTRDLIKMMQLRTPDGYVFRTDLRLRPDPSSTQIAISTEAALDYYESRGQNWERAALIKARVCAGDRDAGAKLLAALSPFVWRKYLDFAAVADIHDLKRRIHAYRGHGEIAVEGHNIKLGRGGIREIEFFVQTQQLIAGGRHPELRGRGTVAMLAALADEGWIDAAARDELTAAYDFLRRAEHRLQMMADEQNHTLPADPAALDSFGRFLGFAGRDAFAETLLLHLRQVERHYVQLFERAPAAPARAQVLAFDTPSASSATLDRLAGMGFRQAAQVMETVRQWQGGDYRALRGEQARADFAALVPVILDQLSRAENPDAAFAAFDRFLAGLRAGGRFFSLLRQNAELVRFVALILGAAPRLADILAQNPHVIDPLIDPSFFGSLPGESALAAELERALAETPAYEAALDAIRRFGQEHMFLIGARILSGSVSAQQAGDIFARLADVLLRAVHRRVETDFAAVHGRLSRGQSAIVALGRLGGREMTAGSDLDLIVIYDFDLHHPVSDGARPLHGAQYFARLTQRLIGALTVQTNYGVLYPVDMRLRPSGRSGPLATQFERFKTYQQNEAWTWEHMALTRARVVSAPPELAARVETAIGEVLRRPRDARAIARDVLAMRGTIAREKGDTDPWDLKYAQGGLIDIEFVAQYLQLVHAAATPDILDASTASVLEKASRLGLLAPQDAEILRPAVRLYQDLTQILRLCLPAALDAGTASREVLDLLARAAALPDFAALAAHLAETERGVRKCLLRIISS
jgi:glutamate-ammonia-ligase adenylyltransferase